MFLGRDIQLLRVKKLDSILVNEEESNATRTALGELKEEMRNRCGETKEKIVISRKRLKQ
jgi:hypothetical protein